MAYSKGNKFNDSLSLSLSVALMLSICLLDGEGT